jgi:CoA-transferase family III
VDRRAQAWASSGACVLTGRPEGPPLGAPAALIDLVERAAALVQRHSDGRQTVDGLALLGERAALGDLSRGGDVSCGGVTRLVPTQSRWLAVSLPRPEDVEALPAWLGCDVPPDDPWPIVYEVAARLTAAALDEQAALLGLPIAAVSSVAPQAQDCFDLPVGAERLGGTEGGSLSLEDAIVIDLSALWAGPLCGQLLAEAGAKVFKVESTSRPDAARQGPAAFFDLLNGAKRSVALDLATKAGQRDLGRLIAGADIVIESSRPRALAQMGIDSRNILSQAGGPRVWASITSHGRGPVTGQRVGFGDVAAAAGGLIASDDEGPCFLADAVADPLTGLVTAAAVLEALEAGGRWLIDAAMAPLAASVAGPLLDVVGLDALPPRARPAHGPAPALGVDTQAVMAELG